MTRMSPLASASDQPNLRVSDMLILLDELHDLVEGENRLLAGGIPVSLSDTLARKATLAGRLDASLKEMKAPGFKAATDRSELASLVSKLQQLRAVMNDNTRMIKRSLDSTRRRIDAIMKALRSEPGRVASYGADGLERRRSSQVANDRLA
jgi:hypothetical protein